MKRFGIIAAVALMALSSLFLQSCGCKEMSDEKYAEISMQLAFSLVGEAFSGKSETELEALKDQKLEEICEKEGFSKEDYDCKTEELKKRGGDTNGAGEQ